MTNPLTERQLAEIRERCKAATGGEWLHNEEGGVFNDTHFIADICFMGVHPQANGDFIAHARQDIPALCDEIDRLSADNQTLHEENVLSALKIGKQGGDNMRLREALEHCRDTIMYVKQYVEGNGLSAEDDCLDSLDKIEQALSPQENKDDKETAIHTEQQD